MRTTGPVFSRYLPPNLREEKYGRRSVIWLSPQENDTFGSWDTLTAKWNSQEVFDSPAFRLCTPPTLQARFLASKNETKELYLDGSCGTKISPTVEKSEGSFIISFTVPDITEDGFFRLQMKDASGPVHFSPIFKLTSQPVHVEVLTQLPPRDTESQGSPSTSISRRSSRLVGFNILLVIVCVLLIAAPLLWLCHRHRKNVKKYFRRWSVSRTSTPALLQRIDPGDGTSVPIPVFMPPQTSRAQLFVPASLGRASGIHQPSHTGSSRSFRLPNRYLGASIYPSLPPILTSSNIFVEEGDTLPANSAHHRRPLLPPGLVSTPLRVHLRQS